MNRFTSWGICAALLVSARVVAGPDASPGAQSGGGDASKARAFAFRVDVPAASIAVGSDGFSEILLPGYRTRETRVGAPDLAATTFRVAIPPGVTPRLEVRVLREDFLPGTRPKPVPQVQFDLAGDLGAEEIRAFDSLSVPIRQGIDRHERFVEDATIYQGNEPWPGAIARLGEIGTFRDQRYVMVTVSPARFDPKAGGVRVARTVELEVHFDGDTGERTEPRGDPRFEAIYREMFVNYAAGTTFRLGAPSAAFRTPAAPAAVSAGPSYTGPVYKIKIRQNRTVRLDPALLASTGFLTQPLSAWKLTSRGIEVPLQVRDVNANDLMDAGDWVQFWGQALDNEPKAPLNTDIVGTDQDIFQAGDFTDENIYFLSVETGARVRMAARDAAPTMTRTPPADFEGVARAEVDSEWRPLGGNDPWYWGPALKSTGAKIRTDSVALPGIASPTSPIRVISVVRGLSENSNLFPDHRTQVTLFNASAQTLLINDDAATFDGRMIYTHDFTWPGSPGTAGDPVQIRLEARPITSGFHEVMLDRIEVRYRRSFQAFADTLEFAWPDSDAEFIVTGLASSAPEVWELTAQANGIANPIRLTGASITGPGPCPPGSGVNCYAARLRVDNDPAIADGTLRRFVVFGSGAIATPAVADLAADTLSDLMLTTNQADLIVIAHPEVLGATCQAALGQLLDWRAENQGITSKIVAIGDIYDEFNDGLPGPAAVRSFLAWVMSANPGEGWLSPKPSFVMLLGDGSFDYKGGTVKGNYVPTQIMFKDDPAFGYYASDSYLTAVVGSDQMPDLVIGRVPARSDGECTTTLQKILGYQQAPPPGNWRRHAVVMSDHGKNFNVNEADEFEATNDLALAWMKRPPHTSRRLRYWTDYCGGTAGGCTCAISNQMRNDIKAAVNGTDGVSDGAGIMQFVGHGNFDIWSDDSFFDNGPPGARTPCQPNGERDTDSLDNGGKLPILFVHNCLSTGLPDTARTLGRDIVKKDGGGTVALFSPSGLTNGYFGQEASDLVWSGFFGKTKERILAVPMLSVYADLCGVGAFEACQNYLLFGDPATRAVFPAVAPPTAVVATPGNARVDLSWIGSATAGARYDVYRAADSATNTYTRINGTTPVMATSYADTGLTNARNYFYYLIAVDNESFESRWSHFNSDCAVNGPDCLRAKPLNPNPPPAPTAVAVVDAEVGGKLVVSWTWTGDAQELKSYEVRYGTSSGVHPTVVNAGKLTSLALSGLQNGQTYYFVVTATNTSDLTSPPSPEKSGVPTFVRGLRAPQFISALKVDKSGNDALLSWPAVTTDIYGKLTIIARYEIYRGTAPSFVPGPGDKIGETTSTSFPDPGALLAGPAYYYLVVAVDAQGSRGGLGHQLPNGIGPPNGSLSVGKSTVTAGNVVLSWPAVTTDFDGRPIAIDHYEVYARATPFTIANVRDGLIPMILSTAAVTVDLTPAAGAQFYTVLAVDQKGNKSPF